MVEVRAVAGQLNPHDPLLMKPHLTFDVTVIGYKNIRCLIFSGINVSIHPVVSSLKYVAILEIC